VRTPKNFMSCSFLPDGNVITLNGTATRLLNTGEFYMYRNEKFNLTIKGLQGYCSSGLVLCLKAIAIETEGNVIKAFAPWSNNDMPVVEANGAAVLLSERLVNVAGLSISQESKSKLVFTLQQLIKLHIRVLDSELSVILKIVSEYCSGSVSICGSCDDMALGNYTNNSSHFESAVRVKEQHLSLERNIDRMSRFSLQFQRVGISTNVLTEVYMNTNLTLEIRFTASKSAVHDSTLICYSKSVAFGIVIKRTVQIVIAESIYDTRFIVEANMTNQVTLVYEYLSRKLTLYFTNSNGLTWFYPIILPEKLILFDKLGVLSIGQWISSKETKFFFPARGFEGVLETMRIWKRAYSYLDVRALFTKQASADDNDLISQWDFSEGSGNIVRDVVSKIDFYLAADVKAPLWIVSTAKRRKLKTFEEADFKSIALKKEAARKCQSIIFQSDLYTNCKELGNETLGFFYMSCLRRIAKTRSTTSVVVAAALLSDYCQVALQHMEWPAKQMCHELSSNTITNKVFDYIGHNCSKLCLFGKSNNQNCTCHHGYWGINCSNVCPGGAQNPCFGHGFCEPDNGICECDTNWQGNTNCSACSEGFYGPECLVGMQEFVLKTTYVSKVFAKKILQKFDGLFLTVKEDGEYVGFESRISELFVNLRFVQRFRSVALVGVAMRIKQSVIVIHTGVSNGLSLTVDDKIVAIQDSLVLGNGFWYTRVSQHHFVIKSNSGFEMSIYNESLSLSVEMTTSSSICGDSSGLLGSCMKPVPCDRTSLACNDSNISSFNTSEWTSATIENTFKYYKVAARNSLFTAILRLDSAPLYQTSAQTCLMFDRTGLVTGPLHGILVSNYASIQLMVKVDSKINAGTIISFAYNTTLSVILNGTIKIQRENVDIDTGLSILNNTWTQLTIVYQKVTGVLQVFTKHGTDLSQSVVHFVGFGWFEDGLSLGIGISQVSKVASVSLSYPLFSGTIDDVKIWNIRLDAVTIDAHWKSDVGIYEQGLKALWKMDEGTGMVIHDSIGSNHISMPPSGWVLPSWVNADYEMHAVKQTPLRRRQTLKSKAEAKCKKLLYDQLLQDTCGTALGNSTSVYYHGCVESILAEDNLKAADNSLLSLSLTCMKLLNLTSNPAKHLCNYTASKEIDGYYGFNCSQKCEYGELTGGKCICFKGYWGMNCSYKCPGGPSLPCHGHGVCLQTSGKCVCDHNWRGDLNCSSCTVGWLSPHCLKVEAPNPFASEQMCSVKGLGIYQRFNGMQQRLIKYGEYVVVNSSKVQVTAATVECLKDAVCTNEVKFRSALHQISLRMSPGSISSSVFINERHVLLNGHHTVTSDISVALVSPGTYRILFEKDLRIEISTNGFYFLMSIYTKRPTCDMFNGLCGSCLTGAVSNTFPIAKLQSSIYFGQYSLYFNKATMYTKEINIFSTTQTTIEFLIKSCNPTSCGGPIFSFASKKTVYITNYLTVKLFIGDMVYDSGIQTTIDNWNHVIVTCSKLHKKIDIYIAHSTKILFHRSFMMEVYPFTGPGLVSVGSWTPSMAGADKQPLRTFIGEIDEIRVWDRYFDYAMVRQRVFSNINRPLPGLKAAWKMNEGEGSLVKDLVGNSDLTLPEYPLGKPAWRVSTAPLGSPVRKISFEDDTHLQVMAASFCQEILIKGHVGKVCSGISENVKQFYVSHCILGIVQTQLKSASLKVVTEYSDICQKTLSLSDWPARPLCNLFSDIKFPNWIGTNCTINCVYGSGSYKNPDICVCDKGYWGASCNGTCGGGFNEPCSNHGICDQKSGQCKCEPNWSGDQNCSTCSNGFTGDDCSVATATTSHQSAHAFVSLRGHITLFGGFGIVLKDAGEYRLIYSSAHNVSVYGRFVVCFRKGMCLNSLVFKFSETQIVLHAPYEQKGSIKVWLNNKLIDIYLNRNELLASNIQIIRKQTSLYTVVHLLGEYRVSVIDTYLTLDTSVSGKICNSSYGLLGNCQKNMSDILNSISLPLHCSKSGFTEFVAKKSEGSLTINETYVQLFTKRHLIPLCESSFIYEYGKVIEYRDANSGYALKFNASSLVLLNSTVLNANVCTFDFMILIEQDGTILSYGSITTFLLVTINFELQIWIGSDTYRTGLYIEHKAWNQVVLQWRKSRNQFTILVFDQLGVLHWRRIDLSRIVDVFHAGGVFGIGQWQPALNNSYPKPNMTFIGLIEQLRIWEKEFSPAVGWQLWSRDVRRDSRYLRAKIDFDNVEEDYIFDGISNGVVSLANKPWRKPLKVFSGVSQKSQLGSVAKKTGDTELIGRANAFCNQFVLEGPLHGHCSALGNGMAMFYYRLCVEMGIETGGDLSIGLHAVVSYADYCQAVLNMTFWPARDLCASFNNTRIPARLQESCSSKCLYGLSTSNEKCKCIKGYWGEYCDKVCPGGAFRACNNNGACNTVSGKCKCKINWDGDASCGECSLGWIGKDCQIAWINGGAVSRVDVTSAFLIDGNMMLFSGHVLAFTFVGQYWLYKDSLQDSDVRIWHSPCFGHKLCLSAVRIRFSTITIVITAPKPDYWKERVLIDDKLVRLTSAYLSRQAGKRSISLHYAARNEIIITVERTTFASVRIFERSLSIAVEERTPNCSSSGGIWRTCFNDTGNSTANEIAERLHLAWKIDTPNNIVGITDEIYSLSSAEYAVIIENTGAVSSPLCESFEGSGDYTIEFLVKPMSSQFVIMSYSLSRTFAVYANETYRIITAQLELDTRIFVSNSSWQHLTMMFWSELKRLDFYIFERSKPMQRRTFTLPHSPFFPCGIMAIGQWFPSTNMPEGPRIANGRFYIDEIRVWNRAFDPLTVQQNYKMNVFGSHPGLKALWKVNEFEGDILYNLKNRNESLHLPNLPWQRPLRALSTAEIHANITDIFTADFVENITSVEEHCRALFYSSELWTNCNSLSSTLSYFYSICIKDVALNNISYSVYSIVSFADVCQSMLKLTIWPATSFCRSSSGTLALLWIGHYCKTVCVFGKPSQQNSTQCVCDYGYWGKNCSQQCPGGALLPCSGHGKCMQNTGECLCDRNWNGNTNCSACGADWLGPSCNVSTEPFNLYKDKPSAISFITSTGQVTTFNGYTVLLQTTSEVILIHSQLMGLLISAKWSPCSTVGVYNSLCLTFITIRYHGLNIVVRAPYFVQRLSTQIVAPILIVNNKLVKVDHVTYISSETTLNRVSRNNYALVMSRVFELRIRMRQKFDVNVQLSRQYCASAKGILGSCDSARESLPSLNERLSLGNLVPSSDSVIDYGKLRFEERAFIFGGLYGVHLKDTGIVSDLFTTLNHPVVSLELYLNTMAHGGTLIAYVGQSIFAISNEANIRLFVGSDVISTDLSMEIGKWNQLFVVYRRKARLLILYLTTSNQSVTRAFRTSIDILPINGRFAIGQWMPSPSNIPTLPNSTFDAKIDEFRIWSRRSNPSLIHRNQKINPTSAFSQDLLHLFKFDNLSTSFVKDEMTSIRFTYQKWYPGIPHFSTLNIGFAADKLSFNNKTLEEAAMKKCREVIYEGHIYNKCEQLGYGIISRFYIECLHTTARTNDLNSAAHVLTSFADHCIHALGIKEQDILKPFCAMARKDYFSEWSGVDCKQSCIYGVWSENVPWHRNGSSGTEDRCVCEHGYWGQNCSQICPGGILSTCNNRGTCSYEDGSCTCNGNRISVYVNDTNKLPCTECRNGWKGAECNIGTKERSVNVENKNIDRGYCIATGSLHFITFDRTSLSIDLQGMHLLVGNDQMQIYVISKACGIHPSCRRISEVFLVGRFGESSILLFNGQLKVTTRKRNPEALDGDKEGGTVELKPTIYIQSLMRDTTIRYGGANNGRLEIQAGAHFYVLIFLYSNELSVIVEERSRSPYVAGICSFVLRNSSQIILAPQAKFRNGTFMNLDSANQTVISQKLIASEFMTSFAWKNSSSLLLSNTSRFWAKGPGYMFYFLHSGVTGELVSAELNEWTIELWIHPGRPAENGSNICDNARTTEFSVKQQILSIEHQNNQYLSLSYNGKLHFEWDEFTLSTSFSVLSNTWTHVSVSWRSYDGRLSVQALSPCGKTQSLSRYNIKLGKAYSLNGTLVLGQYLKKGRQILENDFIGAVDELRIWSYARSNEDTEAQSKKRLYFPTPGLLIAGYFDEINQSKAPIVLGTNLVSSSQVSTSSSKFTVSHKLDLQLMPSESPPEWLPSTVPFELVPDYAAKFRTSNLSSIAKETCHQKFYTGLLNTYCSGNLPHTAAFYYQACLSDIAATENIGIADHLEVSFALLCGKEINIQVCRLRHIYDGFPVCGTPEQQPVWTPTTISLLLLGIIVFLAFITAVTVRLRKSRIPQVGPEDRYADQPVAANDQQPLFERDAFIASSLQSLQRPGTSGGEDISGLVKTSEKFLDDGDILIQTSPRRAMELSKPSLFNSYEENETEF